MDGFPAGALYPTSMRINQQGRLVVNFRTKARFRGLFVESHSGGRAGETPERTLSSFTSDRSPVDFVASFSFPHPAASLSSMVMSVDHPGLTFNLTSVRSEPTYNQPVQQWTFTSDFAVRLNHMEKWTRGWTRSLSPLELQGSLLPLLLPSGERLLRNVHGEADSVHGGPASGAHSPAHLQPQRTDHI